jgi:4-oxalocrotonate tautomerase
MPYITIENAGNLSREQKEKLIQKITEAITEVTGKPKQYIYIRIDEVPRENFAINGKLLG